MNCPECGLENPPVHDACAFCSTPIDPAERREEWERLTPALRAEFSTAFDRALKVATGELPLGLIFGLFVLFGFVGALGMGYLFGLNLSLRRSIED